MTTPSTTLASRPEANSAFDYSYKGIYKGIVIGNTSGAIYVDLYNDDKIWAKLQTDNNETFILENVPLSESDGKDLTPYFIKFKFANENVSFEIKLDDTGNNVTVSSFNFFSNKNSKVSLVKERSTSLIKCYTGSFTSMDETGKINFTSDGQLKVVGLSKELNALSFVNISGEINVISPNDVTSKPNNNGEPMNQYLLNANLHIGQISGLLNGYKFDGDWMYEESELGSWHATRIL